VRRRKARRSWAITRQGRSNQSSLKLRCIAGGAGAGVIAAIVPTATILAGIRAMRGNCAPVRGDGGIRKIVKAALDARRTSLANARLASWVRSAFWISTPAGAPDTEANKQSKVPCELFPRLKSGC
jgi:hypothetical protein